MAEASQVYRLFEINCFAYLLGLGGNEGTNEELYIVEYPQNTVLNRTPSVTETNTFLVYEDFVTNGCCGFIFYIGLRLRNESGTNW